MRYMRGPSFAKSFPGLSPVLNDRRIRYQRKMAPLVAALLQCREQSRFIYGHAYLSYGDRFGDTLTYTGKVDMWLFYELFCEYMMPRLLLVRSFSFDDNNDVGEYIARIFYHLFEFTPLKKDHFILGNKNGELFQLPMFIDNKI